MAQPKNIRIACKSFSVFSYGYRLSIVFSSLSSFVVWAELRQKKVIAACVFHIVKQYFIETFPVRKRNKIEMKNNLRKFHDDQQWEEHKVYGEEEGREKSQVNRSWSTCDSFNVTLVVREYGSRDNSLFVRIDCH